MGGGIKRNKSSLPKGRSGIYGGTAEPQPGDEVVGGWTRSEREEMSARFAEAMARELRTGQAESSTTIAASVEPRRR